MIKRIKNKILFLLALGSIFIGGGVSAAGLVPCEGIDDCNFDTLILLLNNIASFIFFRLPIILLVVFFAWNGINLIIYRDRPAFMKLFKKNIWNVLLGYLLVVGAYLLVKTFITIIAGQDLTFKVFFN